MLRTSFGTAFLAESDAVTHCLTYKSGGLAAYRYIAMVSRWPLWHHTVHNSYCNVAFVWSLLASDVPLTRLFGLITAFVGKFFILVSTDWAQNRFYRFLKISGMEWVPRRIAGASHFEAYHLRDTCCSFLLFVVFINMTEQSVIYPFTQAITAS